MSKFDTKLLRIGTIGGMYYTRNVMSQNLIIYGIGAPIPPDNGTVPDAKVIEKYDVDIFVPDYIGYGRSDGVFTPINCINTFLILYEKFTMGCFAQNYYMMSNTLLQYKRIIFIGRSFGGTYVPLLPRFNKNITELAIFCPVVDSKSCGSVLGEETNSDFLRSMNKDGYHHLYRGIKKNIWKEHLENHDDLSPMDNITYLSEATLFIGHGKKDQCVNYAKSQVYYEKIMHAFPEKTGQYKLSLLPQGGHDTTTTHKAIDQFLSWIKIAKI